MSGGPPEAFPRSFPNAAVPSRDGLRLIFAGTAYLVAICFLQLAVFTDVFLGGAAFLPPNVLDVRDVVALFGWVGLMISGVGVIIVPNHLKVRVRPAYLPRVHLVLANVGLVGFLGTSIAVPPSAIPGVFLALMSVSFLVFGAGILGTVYPFVRRPNRDAPPRP